jgi:opacity protein-like surface antigen
MFDIPLTKPETPGAAGGLSLKLGAGVGIVNVSADIDSISAAGVPGVTATVDGDSWELGGQAKIGLSWQLTHAIELGVEYRLMAVGGASFGTASFSDPLLVGIAEVESESVLTHAVQARLSFEF